MTQPARRTMWMIAPHFFASAETRMVTDDGASTPLLIIIGRSRMESRTEADDALLGEDSIPSFR